jgi:hypothetical protein
MTGIVTAAWISRFLMRVAQPEAAQVAAIDVVHRAGDDRDALLDAL